MKKEVKIIIIISIFFVILAVVLGLYLYNKKDNVRFAKEYTNISKENSFVYKNIDDVIEILESGTGIVYLGFPECAWCQAYVEILNEVSEEEGVKEIYYFNIREDSKNNTEKYQKIVSLLQESLDKDEKGNPRVYVPDVTFVVDGDIIGHDNETSLESGDITPKQYWTADAKSLLKEKLRGYIFSVEDGLCTSCND